MSEVLRSTKARFRGTGIDARADTLLYKGRYIQANPKHVNHLTCHSFQIIGQTEQTYLGSAGKSGSKEQPLV